MKIPHLDPDFAKSRKAAWPKAFRIACVFIATIWICFFAAQVLPITQFGLKPRRFEGLIGLFSMPLIHSGWPHLIDNTLPMFLAFLGLFGNYPRLAKKVLIQAVLMTGLLVWFFARDSYHFGASGITHGLFYFLCLVGILRRDLRSVVLLMIAFYMYSTMLTSIFPRERGVSFEYHLFGALGGILSAVLFRDTDRITRKKYAWQTIDDSIEEDDPVIGDQWKL